MPGLIDSCVSLVHSDVHYWKHCNMQYVGANAHMHSITHHINISSPLDPCIIWPVT